MDNVINDVKRLERTGDELSGTNQKLIAAAAKVIDLIINLVPENWRDGRDIGFGYRFHPGAFATENNCHGYEPYLAKDSGHSYYHTATPTKSRYVTVSAARELAGDIANGFLNQLCNKLDEEAARSSKCLEALERGVVVLGSRLQ